MKKKVKFYFSNPHASCVSKNISDFYGKVERVNKFVFDCRIISYYSYSVDEMNEIFKKLQDTPFEIEIGNDEKIKKDKKQYIKCGECKYFKKEIGCINNNSKVRSKHTKTSNSNGCFWGEK